jgi:gamma-glutamylcyclotransferase (GGCT)/AIG2-like uncharacterized protein YtfP
LTPAPGVVSLFVYGTLVDERQLAAVAGRTFPRRPATLPDFARLEGRYPYVVRRAGALVHGFLLDGVDAAALAALDAYEEEGRLYDRQTAEVVVDRARVSCEVYVARDIAGG